MIEHTGLVDLDDKMTMKKKKPVGNCEVVWILLVPAEPKLVEDSVPEPTGHYHEKMLKYTQHIAEL